MDIIRTSIDLLMGSGIDYEFSTTIVEEFHEAADFEEMGKMICGAKRYFLQSFTDRDSVPFGNLHAPSKESLEQYLSIMKKYVPDSSIRGVE
jgi:pyruvate formate lyase activating enzyme